MAMSAEDLRSRTPEQLRESLLGLKKEQFNLRFQVATGKVDNTARFREIRRDVARIKTVLNQKTRAAAGVV